MCVSVCDTDGVPEEETCQLFTLCWNQQGDIQREQETNREIVCMQVLYICVTTLFMPVCDCDKWMQLLISASAQ